MSICVCMKFSVGAFIFPFRLYALIFLTVLRVHTCSPFLVNEPQKLKDKDDRKMTMEQRFSNGSSWPRQRLEATFSEELAKPCRGEARGATWF